MKERTFIMFGVPISLVLILATLWAQARQIVPQRIPLSEIPWDKGRRELPGSAMRQGLETMFVAGDGNQTGLYSLMFKVPAQTAIPPHSHPDDRSCFVLVGVWFFGYGTVRDEAQLKVLPPGSNYTEPAGAVHFAGTQDEEAIVECTGIGPTGTTFFNPADDPRNKK